jgi:hypothetical protein
MRAPLRTLPFSIPLLAALALAGAADGPSIRFVDAADATGLRFRHQNGASGQYYMPELLGAGGALVDYDGDGDLDVFLVQGGTLEASGTSEAGRRRSDANGTVATSRLFRNDLRIERGRPLLRFTDVTGRAGVGLQAYGMGVAVGDVDNDGRPDLFVTTLGEDALYRNNGDGTFSDITGTAGVSDPFWSASAAFADYDRDGDLDLFVANYLEFSIAANKRCTDATGARDYCSPKSFRPVPDRLYRNEGGGRFTDVTTAAGVARADGNGLGVSTGDYDGDGWIDFYVANDATPNQLWINRRDGTFADEGPLSGAALNAAGSPEGSMGIASGDFDADGDEDLFVTNIIGETFALYANDGAGNFEDARVRAGVSQPTAPLTGFGTEWADLDNDGWLDLFIANGAVNIVERLRGQPVPFRMPKQVLRNLGSGRFADVSSAAGPAVGELEVSRGVAIGDVDNDGGLDVLITNNDGPARLFLNQTSPRGHWLQVRLEQPDRNRVAIGARVGVERAGRPTLWRRVRTDGSYLSASDHRVHVGLGDATAVDRLLVEWPDGTKERFAGGPVDRVVVLRRGGGQRP